jgi:hypothetical protein
MGANGDKKSLDRPASSAGVAAFLDAAAKVPAPAGQGRGRLIFALDATMSRQPMWDLAQSLQARMFDAAASLGGLDVQLVYYRGFSECRASHFVSGGQGLAELMSKIDVRSGTTQLVKVLRHGVNEARAAKVAALVFVGDAFEEGEEAAYVAAGDLALVGAKAFMFQEGRNSIAGRVFREIARLTGGAYSSFDAGAARRLEALLRAVAAYAAGGRDALALQADHSEAARLLLGKMR